MTIMHWVTTSNIGADVNHINIFDSQPQRYSLEQMDMFARYHHSTSDKITFNVMNVQKQKNSFDCGPFALAFATSLLHAQDPTQLVFMDPRAHLISCFKNGQITPFPATTDYRQPRVKGSTPKYLHCTCRGIDTGSLMTGCDGESCQEWVHNYCEFGGKKHSGDWFCSQCA